MSEIRNPLATYAEGGWKNCERIPNVATLAPVHPKDPGAELSPDPRYFGQSEQVHDPLGETLLAQDDVEP